MDIECPYSGRLNLNRMDSSSKKRLSSIIMTTSKPKSILKYKPENNVVNIPLSTSWLSRIQSKLMLNNQEENEHILLPKQELKKVTFSIGHLTTEHPFSSDESPRDELYEKQKKENKLNPVEDVIDLGSYYDHACIQREENVMDTVRSLLKNNSSTMDLSHQTITVHQSGPLSDLFMVRFGLISLNLADCKLDDETIRTLLYSLLISNTIEYINLSHNNFKSKGYKYIAIFMKESDTIQSMDLSKNTFDKRGMQYIVQGIEYARSLNKIVLDGCIIKSPIIHLSDAILKSSSMTHLSFCNNHIPTPHHLFLSKGLHQLDISGNTVSIPLLSHELSINMTLTHLTLQHCRITSSGLTQLSEALMENRCLEYLDISHNPLCIDSDEGILSLKTALTFNTKLTSLNLSQTELDSSAAIAIAEALPENTTLSRLDLSKNPKIDVAGLLALSVSIKMNHTLTFLDINIPFSDEELANLQNDIVAVCTTNMLKRIEQQKYDIENISESTTLSPSSSTLSISSTHKHMDMMVDEITSEYP